VAAAGGRPAPGGHAVPGYRYDRDQAVASRPGFVHIERGRLRTFALATRPEMSERMDDVLETIRATDDTATRAGGQLVVAVIPDVVQVDRDIHRDVVDALDRYDFDWPQSALGAAFDADGVAAVDLPAFRAAPAEPRLYRVNDTHWSDVGNALAAKEIAEFLQARHLEWIPRGAG
jgi:hypothetical protein